MEKKACRGCGRWNNNPEFGMDIRTGYCTHWEKLTEASYSCDHFISREDFDRQQAKMMEEMEDMDEGGE